MTAQKILGKKALQRIAGRKSERNQHKRVKHFKAAQKRVNASKQITLDFVRGFKLKTYGELKAVLATHKEVDRFLRNFHYLPEHRLTGRQINHRIVDGKGLTVAVLIWTSPIAMASKAREVWMGWDGETFREFRKKYLNRIVANNARYCVHARLANRKNLASQILRVSRERLLVDWKAKFGDDLICLETYVDTSRYKGICYRADNWKILGQTKGSAWYGTHTSKKEGKAMGDRWSVLGKRKGLTSGAVPPKLIMMRPTISEGFMRKRLHELVTQFKASSCIHPEDKVKLIVDNKKVKVTICTDCNFKTVKMKKVKTKRSWLE